MQYLAVSSGAKALGKSAAFHREDCMLALLGLCTIVLLLAVILTKRMSPLVALIVIPVAAALVGGFGLDTGKFVLTGLQNLAGVVGMFVFAILFFGIVSDAGMLDPIIDRILATVGTRPTRIVPGTTLLALLIHLDGSGAVTFLITIPAMLPLYDRVGIDRRILACAASMAAGVNFLPWTGPMIRASAALKLPIPEIFSPLVPVQLVGLAFIFAVSYWLGLREERRLALAPRLAAAGAAPAPVAARTLSDAERALRRPRRFWINIVLTAAVLGTMVFMAEKVPPALMFMLGTALALIINYPQVDAQRQRIDAHAKAAILMASILLAAGVFTGIMQGTGMLKAMAQTAVTFVPPEMGRHIPFALGLVSMPLSMLFDPDSFYFGVLPVVSEVAQQLGVPPVQVAQGALLGQMTTGFPVSPLTPATILVCGLTGIDLADHQKFTFPFLLAASVVMTLACVALGVFPL
jgi:CitMHS family citrate-Mg2+:H+ or citrate-Ca2+:H+ symporter